MPYLNVMTHIEEREDDELLYDLGGREHPSMFFLDAQGEVLARHDAEDPSAKALAATGEKVMRSLELKKKADGGDPGAKVDLAIVRCELGVIELSDLEGELEGVTLTPEQERAVDILRADGTVSDMMLVLKKNRDQAAQDLAAEEFVALYRKGTHPARAANRLLYWRILADHAADAKDASMLKHSIAGLRDAAGAQPSQRTLGRIRELEDQLKALEASK